MMPTSLLRNMIIPARLAGAMVATATCLGMSEIPAMAFSITQTSDNSTLLNALLGDTTGLSNFSITVSGNSQAFGTFTGATAPFSIDSGVVISTGRVTDIPGENSDENDVSADFGTNPDDLAQLDVSFDANATVDKLLFNFVFGSEEFLTFGGSQYNDKFEMLLNGVNLAKLSDGKTVTINNLVSSPLGPYHPDYIDNPVDSNTLTKLNGFTKVLGFEGLLNKNARNTLSIQIRDFGGGRDSAAFIQGNSLRTTPTTTPTESVPEPSTLVGLALVGVSLAYARHRRQQL